MTPCRLLSAALDGARPRRALVLEVANPLAVQALFAAASAGPCPCADGRRAFRAAGGVLALPGPRAPARDEPLSVVISANVHDPGVDVEKGIRPIDSYVDAVNK